MPFLPGIIVETNAEGQQEYSLTLQILALMSLLTVLPALLLDDDFVYPHYHCLVNITHGHRH